MKKIEDFMAERYDASAWNSMGAPRSWWDRGRLIVGWCPDGLADWDQTTYATYVVWEEEEEIC